MWRIAQLIEESGAGGNKNVKNASLWDDTSTAMDWYCRITCENQTNNVHKCCFKYAIIIESK